MRCNNKQGFGIIIGIRAGVFHSRYKQNPNTHAIDHFHRHPAGH